MKELNTFQKYFVEEFYDDYREGLLSRRAFIRRLFFITGSMAATVATMSALGCAASELPDPTEPVPPPEPTATTPRRTSSDHTSRTHGDNSSRTCGDIGGSGRRST